MDCTEARKRISQGITPKSYPPDHAQLGFHLARCPACRAHYQQRQELLEHLLFERAPAPAKPTPSPQSAPISDDADDEDADDEDEKRPSHSPNIVYGVTIDIPRFLMTIAILLAIAVPVSGVLWFTTTLMQAHRDVSAMIVPTAAPSAPITSPPDAPNQTADQVAHNPLGGVSGASSELAASSALTPTTALSHTSSLQPNDNAGEEASADGEAGARQQPPAPHIDQLPDIRAPNAKSNPNPNANPNAKPTPWPTIEGGDSPVAAPARPPTVNTPIPVPSVPPPAGDAITILLLGNDRRPQETGIPRTDTIMLMRLDPKAQRVALFSLPRDMWVEIPGYGANRINAAYVWGEYYGAPGGGLQLARETVSHLLNIPVDYAIMADFEGFIGLIDAIGGVVVHVEKELHDSVFPTMNYGYTTVHFAPGRQLMNGERALTYSRIRHPDSDFMRTRRQQAVIVAIGERLQERGDLKNLTSLTQITGALRGFVQTDMPEERILGLAWAFRNVDVNTITHVGVSSDMVSWGVGGDRYALTVPRATLQTLTEAFLDGEE